MNRPIVSKPDHGNSLGESGGNSFQASREFQLFLDDIQERLNTYLLGSVVLLPSYTVATLPAVQTAGLIYVSDETGGATVAFSDSGNWRRMRDSVIVS